MMLKVCGVEMESSSFAPSDSELYALICEEVDAVSAIDIAYSFIDDLGLSEDAVTAHYYYQRDLIRDGLRETLQALALSDKSQPSAIIVLPGFSPSQIGHSENLLAADVVSYLFNLRKQIDWIVTPCFIPFHTEDLQFPVDKLKHALSLIGFTVVEVNQTRSGIYSMLEGDSLNDAISMLALNETAEELLTRDTDIEGEDKTCA